MKKINLRKIRRRIRNKILGLIPDRILDYISDTRLFKMIRARTEAIEILMKVDYPILTNVIKLLKWENDNDYEQLLDDLDNKLIPRIAWFKRPPFYQPLKYRDYYECLFEGPIGDYRRALDQWVEGIAEQKDETGRFNKDLPEIRTNEEVHIALEKFMAVLSQKLSKHEYDNVKEIWDIVNI